MSEFFKGWRRKMGCGLLLFAIALTGAWMRSMITFDNGFLQRSDTLYYFTSSSGFLEVQRYSVVPDRLPHGELEESYVIYYWWFAVPLTFLSAYLILWKPRKREEPGRSGCA